MWSQCRRTLQYPQEVTRQSGAPMPVPPVQPCASASPHPCMPIRRAGTWERGRCSLSYPTPFILDAGYVCLCYKPARGELLSWRADGGCNRAQPGQAWPCRIRKPGTSGAGAVYHAGWLEGSICKFYPVPWQAVGSLVRFVAMLGGSLNMEVLCGDRSTNWSSKRAAGGAWSPSQPWRAGAAMLARGCWNRDPSIGNRARGASMWCRCGSKSQRTGSSATLPNRLLPLQSPRERQARTGACETALYPQPVSLSVRCQYAAGATLQS